MICRYCKVPITTKGGSLADLVAQEMSFHNMRCRYAYVTDKELFGIETELEEQYGS